MRSVIVHNEVNIEIGRHIAFDLVEELTELRRPMPGHAFANDSASFHVERREQRGRSVPLVVMRAPFGLAKPHRQQRLRAIERLDLRFLVDTQHDGTIGRR